MTDAEGERSVLARGLRRPKPDPARGSAGTWRNPDPISVGREVGFGAQPEGCHRSGTTGDLRSMERGDLMRKVARPDVQPAAGGRVRNPRDFSGGSISRCLAVSLVLRVE